MSVEKQGCYSKEALVEFRGDGGTSHDQSRDEGAKESFALAPGVVHELEEAEIQRQPLLRDAAVWPQRIFEQGYLVLGFRHGTAGDGDDRQ